MIHLETFEERRNEICRRVMYFFIGRIYHCDSKSAVDIAWYKQTISTWKRHEHFQPPNRLLFHSLDVTDVSGSELPFETCTIPAMKVQRFLGGHLDRNLKLTTNATHLEQRIVLYINMSCSIAATRWLRAGIKPLQLYHADVLQTIMYPLPALRDIFSWFEERLQHLLTRGLRICHLTFYSTPSPLRKL